MEVDLFVPSGTDISAIEEKYGDLCEDEGYGDDLQRYWVGQSMAEDEANEDGEWLTYDECVEFCGFCEGAIPGARTLIEGNGGWAQSMISRRDFSTYVVSDERKQSWKETSDRYWAAHTKGVAAAQDSEVNNGQ